MWSTMIDLETLSEFRDCLSHLGNLDVSIYDGIGRLLVPPITRDPIMETFVASESGKTEQESFLKNGVQKAILRKNPSLFKGPMNQYHFFIPSQIGDRGLVLVGNGFYTSVKDLDTFLTTKASKYGIAKNEIPAWLKKIVPKDVSSVSEVYGYVQRLFNLIVRDNYGKTVATEKYRRIATVLELFSEVGEDSKEEELYRLLTEAILFLFRGDTVSVMVRAHEQFIPAITAGRFKNQVTAVSLRSDTVMLSTALKKNQPVFSRDAIELLRLGYPDDIVSLYIFPLSIQDETFSLLSIFNSQFSEEEIDTISRLCSFAAFLLRTMVTQKMLSTHINGLTTMNFALNLSPPFQDPDLLYQSIVEVSSKLVSAEKASLMLPEEAKKELLIKAVRGMNKWIAKSIRVSVGIGIAGRVFVEGKPLRVTDIERTLSTQKRPHYKTGSFVSMPLKIGDETIGVLNLADRLDGKIFTEADMVFLQYFASYASIVIKGAQYYQKSEEMRTLSITDSLTGLFNRRYFDERLFEELQRAIRYDSPFSLAILDIDDFKMFNDTEGHLAGDEILRAIADISRESLRSIDIIARFGGEEFALIMPQTDREEALLVAERVRKNIRELLPATWKNFPRKRITVSVGIATFPEDGKDATTLMKNVDKALYGAKMQGKDRTVVWRETDPKISRDAAQ